MSVNSQILGSLSFNKFTVKPANDESGYLFVYGRKFWVSFTPTLTIPGGHEWASVYRISKNNSFTAIVDENMKNMIVRAYKSRIAKA